MDKKLNVCLLNDSFPPLIDGVANVVINYAGNIQSELGSATVVTPSHPDANDEYDFPVVRYSSLATDKLFGYRSGYPFSASTLGGLKDSNFDIIHSHCPFASTVLGRTLKEKSGAPIIMTYHTKFDEDIKRVVKNPLLVTQITKFVVQNISVCDEVWTVSKGAGENLRSIGYEGKYIVMPNGVDFPKGAADSEETQALRAEYAIPEEMPVFLFVGRLFWYKGLKLIIDSLKVLSDKGIDFRMLIVGDGGDRVEIEEYAEKTGVADKCIFTGAVTDREELRIYYTASNLFLFPSLYDTNGIVVREAAACGLPSVLIKGSCAAEDFTNYHNGILTDNNVEAFSEELVYACGHLAELKQMGENAMNEIYLSWHDAVCNAYDRYFTVIENHRSGITESRETKAQEILFSSISDITNSIQTVRSITANANKKSKRFSQKLIKKGKTITNSITTSITTKTSNITSSISSNIKEFRDFTKKD